MPTAIFYDLENFKSTFMNHSIETSIKRMEKLIEESPICDKIILRQAFISKRNSFSKKNIQALKEHGIEVVEVEIPFQKNTPNMVDFKMNVHIADYVARIRKVKTIILATGDGDFAFLCEFIKSKNKNLVILSDSTHTNRALIKICDDWIDFNNSYNYRKISIRTIFKDRLPDINMVTMTIEEAMNKLINEITKDILLSKLILKKRVSLNLFLDIAGEYIDLKVYKNIEEQKLMYLINYLLWETKLEILKLGKSSYVTYKLEFKDNHDKYENLYNRLINKTPNYDKNKMLNWYSYFKENKSSIKEILYYSSMAQHAQEMIKDQGNSDIKIRISNADKEKIAYWEEKINKDDLNVAEMFYYYEFLTKNRVIYEEDDKFIFVGKTKYKNVIAEELVRELNKLKLTENEAEIKRLKRVL